ncbi:MAG: flippase-like domain-containing protein [bacterium]|nr:flippase-like domain-containing protein [bacterium]
MSKSSVKKLLQAALGIGLVVLLVFLVELGETLAILRNARPGWIAAGLSITVVSRILMAYKWNLLLRARSVWIPQLEILRIYYISNFLGIFLPATVGMDVIRAIFTKRDDNSYPEIISSIIVERLLGMVMIALTAVVGSLMLIQFLIEVDLPITNVVTLAGGVVSTAILMIFVSFTTGFRILVERIASASGRVSWLAGVAEQLNKVFGSYWGYRYHRVALLSFCALTGLEIVTLILWNHCLGLALNIDIDFMLFVLVVPVVTLLLRLPISISGLGIHEGAFVFFLALVGVPREEGFALGILAHAVAVTALLPGGLLYLFLPRYRVQRNRPAPDELLVSAAQPRTEAP